MKVVVSIGGSVLAPDPGTGRIPGYATVIEELAAEGHGVAAVVGGGGVAREYIAAARRLGANEGELDEIGIAVTRLNARLLIAALDGAAAPAPPEDLETAEAALRRGEVPVMGGTVPGHTTDAVSAGLAEYVEADRLVYATSAPGVFDADPAVDEAATKYERLAAADLVDVIADLEMAAGSSAPVDLLAAKLIQRSGLHTVVLDGTDPQRVAAAVRTGEHEGTEIVPED